MSRETRIPRRYPLSAVVLTLNEEANIAACLRSLEWVDEVFVVDSLSADRTVEVSEELGAKVFAHPFEGYAKQRNWAIDNLPFSHRWVLMVDADEQITAGLADEIMRTLDNPQNFCQGFHLTFRFMFLGRWLRHGGLYPTWVLRLFNRQAARFEDRPMNAHLLLDGAVGRLRESFQHYDRRPLSDWISKHNRYAELEAEEYLKERFGGGYASSIPARFWGTQAERKRWVKLRVWNRLPLLMRPFLLFFRNYVLRGGFLDGRPGFIYHLLWSFWYPMLTAAKIIERQEAAGVVRLQHDSSPIEVGVKAVE